MSDATQLEARIGGLIAGYADRAPIDVDPQAMAALAASQRRGLGWWLPARPAMGLGLVLLSLALVSAMVGGAVLVGGYPFEREPEDLLPQRVEPFIGLPPEGAAPSSPESGELVLSFYARVGGIGNEVHGMWLYADGRLIWRRNLEGGNREAFGDTEPSLAVLEQRLTPDGVALVLANVRESTTPRRPTGADWAGRPGVWWGEIQLRDGEQIGDVTWSDWKLPARLADPGSWLPANAWADRQIRGYVPSQHAVCVGASFVLQRLPAAARALLLAKGTRTNDELPYGSDCFALETADARALAGILDGASLQRSDQPFLLGYRVPAGPADSVSWIDFVGILPHGDVVGYGS